MISILSLTILFYIVLNLDAPSSAEPDTANRVFNESQHDIVFVSGWPQSGTSLLQQMFSLNTAFSTHVPGCLKHLGVKCANYNNEGQWLLTRDNAWNRIYRPGNMCPAGLIADDILTQHAPRVIAQWGKYWDLSKSLLVEKSPQSMLKIPLMAQIFKSAKTVIFLVVLKHPATLNVALPRGYSWLTRDDNSGASKGAEETNKIKNSYEEIMKNVQYFVNFMTRNSSSLNGTLDCDYGWLQALEYLETMKLDEYTVKIGTVSFIKNKLSFSYL